MAIIIFEKVGIFSMKLKRIMSLALALAMCMAMAVTASAIEVEVDNGTGSVPVELTAEAATFSVTVPTVLPINVSAAGVVTTATDAAIVNNSAGAVKVTNMTIAGIDDWEIVDYANTDMASMKVNAHQVGMDINGDLTTGDDAISFDATHWASMAAANDTDSDECAIEYDAKVPAQSVGMSDVQVASIVFTIAWDTIEAAS